MEHLYPMSASLHLWLPAAASHPGNDPSLDRPSLEPKSLMVEFKMCCLDPHFERFNIDPQV